MKNDKIIASWKKIEPNDSARQRMLSKILAQNHSVHEKKRWNTITKDKFFTLPKVAVFSTVFGCLLVFSVLTSAETFQGAFRDIFRWDGAITGIVYENATNEMEMHADFNNSEILLTVHFIDTDTAPYNAIETLRVKKYSIVNEAGEIITENQHTDAVPIVGGNATMTIPMANHATGKYILLVSELEGEKKADQPLTIYGTWKVDISNISKLDQHNERYVIK